LRSCLISIFRPSRKNDQISGISEFKDFDLDYNQSHMPLKEQRPSYIKDTFKAIPYCCWNNRGKGEIIIII
jgi:DUF1680 family protein